MNASFVKNIFLTFNAWIQTEISSLEMTFNFCYDNMNLNIKYVHNILCILRLNLYRKTPLWDWPSSHAQKIISYVDTKLLGNFDGEKIGSRSVLIFYELNEATSHEKKNLINKNQPIMQVSVFKTKSGILLKNFTFYEHNFPSLKVIYNKVQLFLKQYFVRFSIATIIWYFQLIFKLEN